MLQEKRSLKLGHNVWLWRMSMTCVLTLGFFACRAINSRGDTFSSCSLKPAREVISEEYIPPTLRTLIVKPGNSSNYFDFIVDTGDYKYGDAYDVTRVAQDMVRYFFTGITVPDENFWVNLNPLQPDNVLSGVLRYTDVGRLFMEIDLKLKKDAARFTDPQNEIGRAYWDEVYRRLRNEGQSNYQVPVSQRLWIIPDKADVYEKGNSATIVQAKLRVCLESEYLRRNRDIAIVNDMRTVDRVGDIASDAMNEIVIPAIEYQVNYSKDYASLRQVYNALILAEYYKQRYCGKNGPYSGYIDRSYMDNLEAKVPWSGKHIFEEYVHSYKSGEYSRYQNEWDGIYGQVSRHYFSGGILCNLRNVLSISNIQAPTSEIPAYDFGQIWFGGFNDGKGAVLQPYDSSDGGTSPVSADEIRRRFKEKEDAARPYLVGFIRDADDKIQPIFSSFVELQSNREVETSIVVGTPQWNPEREMRVIPLSEYGKKEGVRFTEFDKTADWNFLPANLKAIFESGNLLITTADPAADNKGYSILMAVTPETRLNKSEGRTGVLLKDGLPIVVEVNGKEFVLEIKGVGSADGGFDSDYYFLRGGAQVSESEREFGGLEIMRGSARRFNEGNTVRSVAKIHFYVGDRKQGYLLRLSPGSLRATYNANPDVGYPDHKSEGIRVKKTAFVMGEQIGEFFSMGLLPYSHPENLIVVDQGRDFIFTDYSDVIPIHELPAELEGKSFSLYEMIMAALSSIKQIPGYKKYKVFSESVNGLADGLASSGKISPDEKNVITSCKDFAQVRDVLWHKFFAADYYKAALAHGRVTDSFKYLKGAGGSDFLDEIRGRIDKEISENNDEIAKIEKSLEKSGVSGRELSQLRKDKGVYERRNIIFGKARLSVDNLIAVATSTEACESFRKSFAEYIRMLDSSHFWHSEYYYFWKLWNEDIFLVAEHLKQEIGFLEDVARSIEGDLVNEVNDNLNIAKERLDTLLKFTHYTYYLKLLEDPDYSVKMSLLPYMSPSDSKNDDSGKNDRRGGRRRGVRYSLGTPGDPHHPFDNKDLTLATSNTFNSNEHIAEPALSPSRSGRSLKRDLGGIDLQRIKINNIRE